MSVLDQPDGDGHTLVPDDELEHLKLSYIRTRGELNAAEQAGIARVYASRRRPTLDRLLDDLYLRRLHRRMYDQVWDWAGRYRLVDTNIGIDPPQIPAAVRDLVAGAKMWFDGGDPSVEAVRLYHRLVFIHPFVNGNGRFSRLAAHFAGRALDIEPFTWGASLGLDTTTLRRRHLEALWAADAGDLDPLIVFSRS